MEHEISFRGLAITGSADYDPGQPYPSYSCGGVPPSWDAEVSSIEIEDREEFSSWGLLEDFSEGVERMLGAFHRITGRTLPALERLAWEAWEDEILEALCDAESSWEPDPDDWRD